MTWHSLFRKGQHNGIKMLSLSIGLALGVILIAQRSGQDRNVIGQPIPMEYDSKGPALRADVPARQSGRTGK